MDPLNHTFRKEEERSTGRNYRVGAGVKYGKRYFRKTKMEIIPPCQTKRGDRDRKREPSSRSFTYCRVRSSGSGSGFLGTLSRSFLRSVGISRSAEVSAQRATDFSLGDRRNALSKDLPGTMQKSCHAEGPQKRRLGGTNSNATGTDYRVLLRRFKRVLAERLRPM